MDNCLNSPLAERAIDVAVAVVNAPVTAIAVGISHFTGAKWRKAKHATVVCHGGWLSSFAPYGGAWTMGNAILTEMTEEDYNSRPRLHEHEWKHSVQWAVLGPVLFPVLYGLAEVIYPSRDRNPFERMAGLVDGGYAPPPTPDIGGQIV